MPRIFVVNAGGFAEPGGGVIEKTRGKVNREGLFKNMEQDDGLTESIMCSLFGALPSEAKYIPDNNPGAGGWLIGFIGADFTAARTAFGKKTDGELYALTDKEKVNNVGNFFFAYPGPKIPSTDVTILTVAAPNFAIKEDGQSKAFKAGQVEYRTSYNNDIARSITQSYKNIFDHFTDNATKGDKLYLYDIGTSIFSPGKVFNYKYKGQDYTGKKGYKKFVQAIEKEVFLEYKDKICKKGLVVCSGCLSKLKDELKDGAKIEGHKKINHNSFKKPTAKIDMGAKKAVTRPGGDIDKQDDTDNIVRILNAGEFEIDGRKVTLDKNVGKSEIYQSTRLDDEFKGKELDVSKITLTQSSTAQAIFKNRDTGTKVIIHNFANDKTIGGGPGITKNKDGTFQRIGYRFRAQEESLCMKSTLFAALSKFAEQNSDTNVLEYDNTFKNQSTSKSIISEGVSFFGIDPTDEGYIDWGKSGLKTEYLDQVKKVDVVTVAAKRYDERGTDDITDTVKRIREQLAASAHLARENAKESKKSHIVMGAFGCGSFNNDPKLIASIYRKFLLEEGGEFNKAFPGNTTFEFAIPLSKEEHDIVKSKTEDTTKYPNVANYQAFDQYFIQKNKHGKEDEIKRAINSTKIKSTEEERKAKEEVERQAREEEDRKAKEEIINQFYLIEEGKLTSEKFLEWNNNTFIKLQQINSNKSIYQECRQLFLNPQKEDGTKVFAGWGGRLQQDGNLNSNIFTITQVIRGSFAAAIGLKADDKIEIDLNHDDFRGKDGEEPKDLEVILINKLRNGNLNGINKIGTINLQKDGVEPQLTSLYHERKKLFINEGLQGDEVQKDNKINEFLKNHPNEKSKEIAEITQKLGEFIDKSYKEYLQKHGKDNEKRKTGIYDKCSAEQKPLIIFPVGIKDVGGGGVEEAQNNYDSCKEYLQNNDISLSGRNVYSFISIGQYHWEFLKFEDNECYKEFKNNGGGDNACGAYALVGIITDNKEPRDKLLKIDNLDLEEDTKKIISNGDTEGVSSLPATEVRKIIKHLLTKQAEQETDLGEKERIEESKKRVETPGAMIENDDLEIACEAIGIAFCTVHDFRPIEQKIEYFNNLLFDDNNNIKTGSDLYKEFKTKNSEINEEIIKTAIIELRNNFTSPPSTSPSAASAASAASARDIDHHR